MMRIGQALVAGGVVCFGALLGGCETAEIPAGEVVASGAVGNETARWVEAAGVTFARDHGHVRYAIVADRVDDLLVLEQEVRAGGAFAGGRVTWLVEVPGGARGTFAVGEGMDARGWMLEQAYGGKAHVERVYGEVVVNDDGDDGIAATVHLSATRRAAHPGEVIAPTHTVWGEYRFEWMEVAMAGG